MLVKTLSFLKKLRLTPYITTQALVALKLTNSPYMESE